MDRVNRGRMMTLDTKDDRTVFFDLLPIFFRQSGLSFRLKIYTVPGQPMHEVTRRLVLKSVDGIAFIGDSQPELQQSNRESYENLLKNLETLGLSNAPIVLQYNKRDLPGILPEEQLSRFGRGAEEPVYYASALTGEGVFETFFHLLERTWDSVDAKMGLTRSFGIQRESFIDAVRRHVAAAARPA